MPANIRIVKEDTQFMLVPAKPLGDCLFESCLNTLKLHGLAPDINNPLDLRQKVIEHMSYDKQKYQDIMFKVFSVARNNVDAGLDLDVDEIYAQILRQDFYIDSPESLKNKYIAIMKIPGIWGGDIELLCIKDLFDVDIILYRPNNKHGDYTYSDRREKSKTIRLYYHGNHYDSLLTPEEFRKFYKLENKNKINTESNLRIIQPEQDFIEEIPTAIEISKEPSETYYLIAQESRKNLRFEHASSFGIKTAAKGIMSKFELNWSKVDSTKNNESNSELNPFLGASIDHLTKVLNLNCQFIFSSIFSDYCTMLNFSESCKTDLSVVKVESRFAQQIYTYFSDIQDLIDKDPTCDEDLKHKKAILTSTLLASMLQNISNIDMANKKRYLLVCNMLSNDIRGKARSGSALVDVELTTYAEQISRLLKKYNSSPNELDNISILIILHIYEQEKIVNLESNWLEYLKVCYSLATIYNSYHLHNVSHKYLQKCLIVYTNFATNINYPAEIEVARKDPEEPDPFNFAETDDFSQEKIAAILEKMDEATQVLKFTDDLPTLDLEIDDQTIIWRLLNTKYGSYSEEQLTENYNIKIFDDFDAVLEATSFSEACHEIATILQAQTPEVIEHFEQAGCKDQFAVQKLMIDLIADFISKLLNKRKKILTQFAHFHEVILNKITKYEFLKSGMPNDIIETLNGFINQKFETVEAQLEIYKAAINFCVTHDVIIRSYARNKLLRDLNDPKINHSSYAQHLVEKLKFLAKTAINTFEPNIAPDEKRTIFTFTGYSAALSVIVKKLQQQFTQHNSLDSEVRILLTKTLYVDCDLKQEIFSGVNLSIIAQNIVLVGRNTFSIDLSAYNEKEPENKEPENKEPENKEPVPPGTDGKDGASGQNGKNGKAGGHCNIFANRSTGPIRVISRGGNGTNGTHGKDGTSGKDGRDGVNGKQYFDQTVIDGYNEYKEQGSWLIGSKHPRNQKDYPKGSDKLTPGKNLWYEVTTYVIAAALGETNSKEMKGGKGGNGGNAGAKGLGGAGGTVLIKQLAQDVDRKELVVYGKDGKDGDIGKGASHGKNGKLGIDYGKIYPRKSFWQPWKPKEPEKTLEGTIEEMYFDRSKHSTSWIARYYGNLDHPSFSPPKESLYKPDAPHEGLKAQDGVINPKQNAHANTDINTKSNFSSFETLVNSVPIIGDDNISSFALEIAQSCNESFKLNRSVSREQHIHANHNKWIKAITDRCTKIQKQIELKINAQLEHGLKHQMSRQHKDENSELLLASKSIDALLVPKRRIETPDALEIDRKEISSMDPSLAALVGLLDIYNKQPETIQLLKLLNFIIDTVDILCLKQNIEVFLPLFDKILNESILMLRGDTTYFARKLTLKLISQNALENQVLGKYFLKKLSALKMLESVKSLILHAAENSDIQSVRIKYQTHLNRLANIDINSRQNLDALVVEMHADEIYCRDLDNNRFKQIIETYGLTHETNPLHEMGIMLEAYNCNPSLENIQNLIVAISASLARSNGVAVYRDLLSAEAIGSFEEFILDLKHNWQIYTAFNPDVTENIFDKIKTNFLGRDLFVNDLIFLLLFDRYIMDLFNATSLPRVPHGLLRALSLNDVIQFARPLIEEQVIIDLEKTYIEHVITNKRVFNNLSNNYLYLSTLYSYGKNINELTLREPDSYILSKLEITEEQWFEKIANAKTAFLEILFQILKKSITLNRRCTPQDAVYRDGILQEILPRILFSNGLGAGVTWILLKAATLVGSIFGSDILYSSGLPQLFDMAKLGTDGYLKFGNPNNVAQLFYRMLAKLNNILVEDKLKYYAAKNSNKRLNKAMGKLISKIDEKKKAFKIRITFNEAKQEIENEIQETIKDLEECYEVLSSSSVSLDQIQYFEACLKIHIEQIAQVAEIDKDNAMINALLTAIDKINHEFNSVAKAQKYQHFYHTAFETLQIANSYKSYIDLLNVKYSLVLMSRHQSMAEYEYEETIRTFNCLNYFYLQCNIEKEATFFTVNNQVVNAASNIVFAVINLNNGIIELVQSFSAVDTDKLSETIKTNLSSLERNKAFILYARETHIGDDIWELINPPQRFEKISNACYFIRKLSHCTIVTQITDSSSYKCYTGLLINLLDIEQDSPSAILDVIQSKSTIEQALVQMKHRHYIDLQNSLLPKSKQSDKPALLLHKPSFARKIELNLINKVNAKIISLVSFGVESYKKDIFYLARQSLQLTIEALDSGDYEALTNHNDMLEAIIRAKNSDKHTTKVIGDLIKAGINFSSPREIINIIDSGDLDRISIKLCLERFSECLLNSTVFPDPIKLSKMTGVLETIDERLLNIFYKKYIQEYYNVLYRTQNYTQKHALEINENRLMCIINALKMIRVDEGCLVNLINTPIMNWENELYKIRSNQFIQSWPELLSKDRLLTVFMLNRIRLRLGSNGFYEYMDFITLCKDKAGSNYTQFENLIKKIYYCEIDFHKGLKVVNSYSAAQWNAQSKGHDLEPQKELNYEQIIQSISANSPELVSKLNQILTICRNVKQKLHKKSLLSIFNLNTDSISAALIKPKIREYFEQFKSSGSFIDRVVWFFKKQANGSRNIDDFVTNICLAWQYTNEKGYAPRDTQIVALLLYLFTNDSGLLLEIKTGQGKTTILAMLAAVKALLGYKVDIVTSNTDLAAEGQKICSKFYDFLKLQSATIPEKPTNHNYYEKNILYSDAAGFQRDICISRTVNHDIFHGRYDNDRKDVFLGMDEVDSLSLDKAGDVLYLTHEHPSLKYHLDVLLQNIRILIHQTINRTDFDSEDFNEGFDRYIMQVVNTLAPNGKLHEAHEVPEYLHEYTMQHLKGFVISCLQSLRMKTNDHFKLSSNHVTVMDKATGKEAHSTKYSEGLHQFIQLQNGHEMGHIGLCSNFLSNISFFGLYEKIYGMTGTLGSKESRQFLALVYNTTMVNLPSHLPPKFKLLEGKACLPKDWILTVAIDSLSKSLNQPVLIICDKISDVDNIKEQIDKICGIPNIKRNILLYKEEKDNLNDVLEKRETPGATKYDIIIATNKGGRGTDIPINIVAAPQGLHVFLSYLPSNLRIEQQAFGRAARNGENGSGSFIIPIQALSDEDPQLQIERMIMERDEREQLRVQTIQEKNLPQVQFKEELLKKFNLIIKNAMTILKVRKVDKSLQDVCLTILNHRWAFWLESVKDEINKLTHISNDLMDIIKQRFDVELKSELLKILNSMDIFDELVSMPEDAIILGDVYLKDNKYALAIKFYEKAIKLGLQTSYAEQAIALCQAKLLDTLDPENKKSIRRQVKEAQYSATKFKKYYEKSLGLQEFFNKAKESAGEDFVDLHVKALESRISILAIHVDQLTKHVGKIFKSEMLKSAFGNISDETVAKLHAHLQDKKYLTSNFIRKKWLKEENYATLRKMLAKQFYAEPEILFEVLTDKENAHTDIFKITELNDALEKNTQTKILKNTKLNNAIYCRDDIIKILIEEKLLNPKVASVKNTDGTQDEAYEVICKDDFNFQDFNKIDFNKYNNVLLPDHRSNLLKFKQGIWTLLEDAKQNNKGILLVSSLPYHFKDVQIKTLCAYLHEMCYVLKSNTLNSKIKPEVNENLKSEINAILKGLDIKEPEKAILSIFHDLKGTIRQAEKALIFSFVEPENIKELTTNEQNFDFKFFADINLHEFLSIALSKFWFYVDLLVLNLIASIQLAAGLAIIILCPGFALIGEALIELAIQDFMCAASTYMSGERVNWSSWAIQKSISSCLTIGTSLTFGFGVPFIKGGQQIALKVGKIVAKSIATRMATVVTSYMLEKFIQKVSADIVDGTTATLTKHLQEEFAQTFDQLEQLNEQESEGYAEGIQSIITALGKRIEHILKINKRDVNMTNAITNAVESLGNVVHILTKDSPEGAIRTIGAVIDNATKITQLASVFQQVCQFEELNSDLSDNVHDVDEMILTSFIPSDAKQEFRSNTNKKTSFSRQVNSDADAATEPVKEAVHKHVKGTFDNTFYRLFKIKVSNDIAAENNKISRRETAAMRKKLAEVQFSMLKEGLPENCTGNFTEEYKIKKYNLSELQDFLNTAPEMPRHFKLNFATKRANSAQVKIYSKNLECDPYGLFELELIANKERVGIRVFNVNFEPKFKKVLPKTNSHNISRIIDVYESKSLLKPLIYLPVYSARKSFLGKPLLEIEDTNISTIPAQKTLLFSVLYGLRKTAPSHEEIDNYRRELISYANETNATRKKPAH